MGSPVWRRGACVLAAFVVLAVVQSWPLPLHLGTRLTGPPTGDTGVYVWNTWVFRHELVDAGQWPFSTSRIFSLDTPADLSLHNYTAFANLLALPLQPLIGVVAAFNVVYLLNVALAGFGMYLLAKRLTGRTAEAWLAGLVFAWSPFLVARSAAHFSLVAAAPLPLFWYFLDRAWQTQRLRDAAFTGATLAWAAFSDPYYAVYCLMLGLCYLAGKTVAVAPRLRVLPGPWRSRLLLDVGIVGLILLVVGVHVIGGGSIKIASVSVSMRTLYTPMLVLTLLVTARVFLSIRPVMTWSVPPLGFWMVRASAAAILVATFLLAPTLYAVGRRVGEGRMVSAPVLWRSSPPGVDLLAFVMPNPTHPLAPAAVTEWLTAGPGGFVENVASLSLVGFAVLILAWRFAGFRPGWLWTGITVGFGLLSLGPFITIGGVSTYLPTPWALLRYVPVIGAARMPARFVIVATLGFCVLLAFALVAIGRRYPHRRRAIVATVAVALVIELWTVPRTLYSAVVPSIYETIAADPRPVRVLELPFGIRDGLSSLGDFSAGSQFRQTQHGKQLIGGYLSRVSGRRKAFHLRMPVLNALMKLSEGTALTRGEVAQAIDGAQAFVDAADVGYVVMDKARVTTDLRDFATLVFGLTKVGESDGAELYIPSNPPLPRG